MTSTPPELFIRLWLSAIALNGARRANARAPGRAFEREATVALALDDAGQSHAALDALMGVGTDDEAFAGRGLWLMAAIDKLFVTVHPRSVVSPPAAAVRPRLPGWLRDARDRRAIDGVYARLDDHLLVARGPLLRQSRPTMACSADSLADRYSALGVVPRSLQQDGRRIDVAVRRVSGGASRGVTSGGQPGAERIAIMPVAERDGDIVAVGRQADGVHFSMFDAHADLDVGARVLQGIQANPDADIVLAPEFVVSATAADGIASGLPRCPPGALRLLIAGSGRDGAGTGVDIHNEARALNAVGAVLWRQRKLWPAAISRERAVSLGLPDPGEGKGTFEDTGAGDTIEVVDIDGLGRCVILICQDLESHTLADELVSKFQPDWVFVPILDWGVSLGRWMHTRCFELSRVAQSRFVVASATAWASIEKVDDPDCGLAVGPQRLAGPGHGTGSIDRAVLAVKVRSGSNPGVALVSWEDGSWLQTTLGAAPPRPPSP